MSHLPLLRMSGGSRRRHDLPKDGQLYDLAISQSGVDTAWGRMSDWDVEQQATAKGQEVVEKRSMECSVVKRAAGATPSYGRKQQTDRERRAGILVRPETLHLKQTQKRAGWQAGWLAGLAFRDPPAMDPILRWWRGSRGICTTGGSLPLRARRLRMR